MIGRPLPVVALLVLPLLLAPPSPSAKASGQLVFSSKVESVRVDVLVTESGRPVTGLRPADFEVVDDGVRQEVQFATLEQMALNVTIALDASRSVVGESLRHLQLASRSLLERLAHDDRAALFTFNDRVTLRSPLSGDLAPVRRAVEAVIPEGETSLIDCVYSGLVIAEADVGRSLLLVFTDGIDTSSYLTAGEVEEAARRTDVVVYGVAAGAGSQRAAAFLNSVAGRTGGRVLTTDSTIELQQAFVEILQEFRQRYLLSYTPKGPAKPGWHRLEVRVKGRRADVRARPGYQSAAGALR